MSLAGAALSLWSGHALFINSQHTHTVKFGGLKKRKAQLPAYTFGPLNLRSGNKSLQTAAEEGPMRARGFSMEKGLAVARQIFNLLLFSCISIMDGIDRKENGWQ